MTVKPANYDLAFGKPFIIYQGATNTQVFTIKNPDGSLVNLTGKTARMFFRTTYTDSVPFLQLTTENGEIALGGVLGTITLNIPATQSASITQLKGVWDLELVTGSIVHRIMQGTMQLSLEVTR